MLLLIDAGNTRVKWAVATDGAPGDWIAQGAVAHAGLEQQALQWRSMPLARAVVSNVAGAGIAAGLSGALAAAGLSPSAIEWFRSSSARAGVTNGYREPERLGCDRFASLLGARHRYPAEPLLVVTCGTATTIDFLDAAGHFGGGMILPGLATMAQSLAVNTAQLPSVDTATRVTMFADSTSEAIASGCIHAQVGAIMQARHAVPGARCLLSGGAAPFIAPHLPAPFERVEQLVLLGLHVAAGPGVATQ